LHHFGDMTAFTCSWRMSILP